MAGKTHTKKASVPASRFEKDLLHTLSYFALFSYPPTAEELFLYHKTALRKKDFSRLLIQLQKTGRVIERTINVKRYVRNGQEKFFDLYRQKRTYSQEKEEKLKKYLRILKGFSQIQFIGISGSIAAKNAQQDDDIDLFIITEQSRLWTGRMIAGLLAFFMGIKRMRGSKNQKDKVCLNLFFDAQELTVPVQKQTEYIAHEILQLVPLVNKNTTYERFLHENRWITTLFPHAQARLSPIQAHPSPKRRSRLGDFFEHLCRGIQTRYMQSAITRERITGTQLWFFPQDYEKRVQKHLK